MSELPTAAKVARALADIEAVKHGAEPAVVECLDAIADMVRKSTCPATVFDFVLGAFAREEIRVLAAAHSVRLYETTTPPVTCGYRDELFVVWQADGTGIAAIPRGQAPRDSLEQLRAFIRTRQEERRLAADFQASVAAGYVEGLDAWDARVNQASK